MNKYNLDSNNTNFVVRDRFITFARQVKTKSPAFHKLNKNTFTKSFVLNRI